MATTAIPASASVSQSVPLYLETCKKELDAKVRIANERWAILCKLAAKTTVAVYLVFFATLTTFVSFKIVLPVSIVALSLYQIPKKMHDILNEWANLASRKAIIQKGLQSMQARVLTSGFAFQRQAPLILQLGFSIPEIPNMQNPLAPLYVHLQFWLEGIVCAMRQEQDWNQQIHDREALPEPQRSSAENQEKIKGYKNSFAESTYRTLVCKLKIAHIFTAIQHPTLRGDLGLFGTFGPMREQTTTPFFRFKNSATALTVDDVRSKTIAELSQYFLTANTIS